MKYEITYKCGHSGSIELFGPGKDRQRKIDWLEEGLCPECYKNEIREKEKEEGLTVSVFLDLKSLYIKGCLPDKEIVFVFGGDSYGHKEEIKILGGIYTDEYPTDNLFANLIGVFQKKMWVLPVTIEEYKEKLKQVEKIARVLSSPTQADLDKLTHYKAVIIQQMDKELELLGSIPPWPEEIKSIWPDGATWNKKFYGKPGRWSIYLNNIQVSVSDDLKISMEKTLADRNVWKEKKKEIEKKYKGTY